MGGVNILDGHTVVYGGQTSAQRFPQPTKIVLPSPLCADRFGSVIF